jgi:predicted glycogen debranching enzyme
MIRFGQDVCRNLDAALRREWLETNGLGGFASSTINGINTRRYHGLLVAATKPPVGRFVLLSKLEETLLVSDRSFDLSANRYPGVVHPQGFRYLKQFRLDPFPVFTFEVEGLEIEKTVFMVQGESTTVIQYEIKNRGTSLPDGIALEIRPLIAFRDYHSTTHENGSLNSKVEVLAGVASVTPYAGLPTLYLAHDAKQLEEGGGWYRNFEYDAERERGLDFVEDLFNPLVLHFDLSSSRKATVIASTNPRNAANAAQYRQSETSRRRANVMRAPREDEFVKTLTAATDQFIVARGEQKTVIAGYHWFSDWGRDTMIALPGLTLPTKRYDVARSILRTFAQHVDQGMLPNRFPDAGETPEYTNPVSRDGAYHQGTVWPWLMGPFITAYIKVNGNSEPARRQVEAWLGAFKEHLSDAGLGHISEVCGGDGPHQPGGCIAQAWSVAELLRATIEDFYGIRPVARMQVETMPEANQMGAIKRGFQPSRAVANE